ncbi:MAG: hypothetical protein ACI9KE_000952 [Polyangiales bacterium]|jgi:hypothetical protein
MQRWIQCLGSLRGPDLRGLVDQIEVAVVDSCQDVDLDQVPFDPMRRVVIRTGELTEALGELPSGTYGLQARAIDEGCTVIAAGCASIDIRAGETGELSVALSRVDLPSRAVTLCPSECAGGDAGAVDATLRDAGPDDGGPADIGQDLSDVADVGMDAGCRSPRLVCGASCVDPAADPVHCGECDNVCDGMDVCFEGICRQDACLDALGLPCERVLGSYIKASNTDGGDSFGWAIGLDGDTLAVGAWREDSGASGVNGDETDNTAPASGAVYVFRRVAGTWAQEAYLKASNSGGGDAFGWSVSLNGDTLAVGSRLEDGSTTGVGGADDNEVADSSAVYVFQRTGTQWAQEAYLKASNTGESDSFGYTVSLSGDTLAVGAPSEDSLASGIGGDEDDDSALGSGAVYVFQRTGTTWSQQAYLKASNTDAYDSFGYDVSLSGDTLAVGAQTEDGAATDVDGDQDDNTAMDSGAVYVFQRTGTTWSQQAYLKASNTDSGDIFGVKVSLSGNTLAIAAVHEDSATIGVGGDSTNNDAIDSGAVYVFQRTGTVWNQQAYLKASNAEAGDFLGWDISLNGDTLAVAGGREDSTSTGVNGDQTSNSAEDSGAIYLFGRSGTTWRQLAYLKPFSAGAGDNTGFGLSVSGTTLIAGAPSEDSVTTGVDGDRADNSAAGSGAVYSYQIAP